MKNKISKRRDSNNGAIFNEKSDYLFKKIRDKVRKYVVMSLK